MKKEIIEGNKLIARFYGRGLCSYHGVDIEHYGTNHYPTNKIKYHSSWDWLIPVVEKIEHIGLHVNIETEYTDIIWLGSINEEYPFLKDFIDIYINYKSGDDKIIAPWLAVIEFIKWYKLNEQ